MRHDDSRLALVPVGDGVERRTHPVDDLLTGLAAGESGRQVLVTPPGAEHLERDRAHGVVVLALVDADIELVHARQCLDREAQDGADLLRRLLRTRQRRGVDRGDSAVDESLPRSTGLLSAALGERIALERAGPDLGDVALALPVPQHEHPCLAHAPLPTRRDRPFAARTSSRTRAMIAVAS